MKKVISTLAIVLTLLFYSNSNILSAQQKEIVVQIPKEKFGNQLKHTDSIIVTTKTGQMLMSQFSHKGDLLVLIPDRGINKIFIGRGLNKNHTTTCGSHYPERLDDIAWENNLMAYRTYGPALQRSGERAYGYDIWTKSTSEPVVKERYNNHLYKGISYHEDHGNGMDVYAVGPTLGGGTAAPFIDSSIIFPYCWDSYEILDNGPIRFTVKLKYPSFTIGNDTITEIRTITLDHGSYMNRTIVEYKGLKKSIPIVAGIVLHSTDINKYYADPRNRFITVQDPTQSDGNGEIFAGVTAPKKFERTMTHWEHLLAVDSIAPNQKFEYLWGASWSRCGMDMKRWNKTVLRHHKELNKEQRIKIIFTNK